MGRNNTTKIDLDDRQLVRSAATGEVGHLEHIRGNLAFVQFPGVDHLEMCAVGNIKPAADLFIWPRYFEEAIEDVRN